VPILYRNNTEWTFQFPSSTGSVPLNTGRELEPVRDWCRSSETVPCAIGENRGTAAEPIGNSSHQSLLLPQFRNCTLRKEGAAVLPWNRLGTPVISTHLLSHFRNCSLRKEGTAVLLRNRLGTPVTSTRATVAAQNKQPRNGDLSGPVPPFTRQEAAIRNAVRLMGARLIFGFYQTEKLGLIF